MPTSDPSAHVLAGARSTLGSFAWRRVAVVGGVIAASVLLMQPSVASLWVTWNDTEARAYTHGPLIALVCVWLFLQRRDELSDAVIDPVFAVTAGVAVISIAWVIALRSGLQLIHEALFPFLVWLTVWAAVGIRVAKICAFSILYLYFAVPIWSIGNGVLQAMTVFATDLMLKVAGLPAHVDGNFVHIPSGVFEIAGGCSGLHYFVVALAIAALFGEMNRDSPKVRVLLFLLAGVIAALTNWIRVFVIIVAGHFTEMQHYLVKVDHYYFGWGLFAIGMVAFFFFARHLPVAPASPETISKELKGIDRASLGGPVLAIVALAVGPLLLWLSDSVDAAPPIARATLPSNPDGWETFPIAHTSWQPQYQSADSVISGEYRRGTQSVNVFVASYGSQAQGKELIGYDNSIAGEHAEVVSTRALTSNGPVREIEVRGPAQEHALIWYQYQIGSRSFSNDLSAQLQYGASSLLGPVTSRIVALRASCANDCVEARMLLEEFSTSWQGGTPLDQAEQN
jgi:EpsI family protein